MRVVYDAGTGLLKPDGDFLVDFTKDSEATRAVSIAKT